VKNILIIGATSAIARACCRQWLAEAVGESEPVSFFLVGRSAEKLEQTGSDLLARGARSAVYHVVDLADIDAHGDLLDAVRRQMDAIDVVLLSHGTLPDQAACERDATVALHEFENNATSFIALLTRLAHRLELQGRGTLAVITSVAGDRGRPSNYLYGSAKAAVSTFCEGLRARLFKSGVHVMDIRPGFVDTPMTEALDLPRMLVATPETVARRIVRGVERRRDVLYAPAFWALIMLVIRTIPRPIFKRLSL
jgi:decaprenylphospho-beta-D-erythro-pentofuranosid-2-ulose 2-reductase